jgi:hypothetical protein
MKRHAARIFVFAIVALATSRAAGTEPFQPMARVGYLLRQADHLID